MRNTMIAANDCRLPGWKSTKSETRKEFSVNWIPKPRASHPGTIHARLQYTWPYLADVFAYDWRVSGGQGGLEGMYRAYLPVALNDWAGGR